MIADVPDNIDFWEPTPCLTDFTSITHREDTIIVLTDGYKYKEGDIFIPEYEKKISFTNYCSIDQVIRRAVRWLLYYKM